VYITVHASFHEDMHNGRESYKYFIAKKQMNSSSTYIVL